MGDKRMAQHVDSMRCRNPQSMELGFFIPKILIPAIKGYYARIVLNCRVMPRMSRRLAAMT
jgi:hypothetical protein